MRRSLLGLGAVWFGASLLAAACGGGDSKNTPGGSPDTVDAAPSPDATMPDDGGPPSGDGAPAAGDAGDGGPGTGDAGDGGPGGGEAGVQTPAGHIVVDQIGYRTQDEKIAVIRNPQVGFDVSDAAYTPGPTFAVVDASSSAKVYEGAAAAWNGGAVDDSSGDVVWRFDFSSVTAAGRYVIVDETTGARSAPFKIADDVYADALVQATRIFYYQRDNTPKTAGNAGSDWADTAGHPQDQTCGDYLTPDAGGNLKDLRGGWYEAGDQAKYAGPAASDVIALLRAYTESPGAFTDATNIPESGNSVPDVLDHAKWALDWLLKMQNADGSVLSVVSHGDASPPSAATTACVYGPANTATTLEAAAAFAFASKVFASGSFPSAFTTYATTLQAAAVSAYNWASANPNVVFQNVPAQLGTREQDTDDLGRTKRKVQALAFLYELTYELTGDTSYRTPFDTAYAAVPTAFDPLDVEPIEALVEYTRTPGATAAVVADILAKVGAGAANFENFQKELVADADPYAAYIDAYKLESNRAKVGTAALHFDAALAGDGGTTNAAKYAERYLHYVHGANPMGLVYLTNMNGHGATSSLTSIFSTWFAGSKWGRTTSSQPGPPPGYFVIGPNSGYAWEPCCADTSCMMYCPAADPAPPSGQPPQKSYKDFNDGWPSDSWLVSEPYDLGQALYVRLVSKFAH